MGSKSVGVSWPHWWYSRVRASVMGVPWLKRNARLTSSSFSCVESSGMTYRRTPAAKSLCADGMSLRMFHSGCGGVGVPKPTSP